MNRAVIWVIVAAVIVLGVWFVMRNDRGSDGVNNNAQNATTTSTDNLPVFGTQATSDEVVVESPKLGDKISSPLTVRGRARGSWYFEASAPVTVIDARGNVLGQGFVMALGEWMTTEFVPFEGTVRFDGATTEGGAVVFMNDNPSGDPERSRYIAVPVFFR